MRLAPSSDTPLAGQEAASVCALAALVFCYPAPDRDHDHDRDPDHDHDRTGCDRDPDHLTF